MPDDGGWQTVQSQAELDQLLDHFGGFHDGLIKEVHLLNAGYVRAEDLGMLTAPFTARVLFQRQFRDPAALEVMFEGLHSLRIDHPWEIYSGDSGSAESRDRESLLALRLDSAEFVFRKLRYRDASDWLGAEMRFGADWR